MEEKIQRVLRNFSVLSKRDKQKQIIHWVKKGSELIIPILKSIASEDSEVQIRFLARKGLYHIKKRFEDKTEFNFESQTFDDLIEAGVIDPKKVTRTALENAASISLLLINTEAIVSEQVNNPSSWQPPAGWRPPEQGKLEHKY